jgi:hypothetical protein
VNRHASSLSPAYFDGLYTGETDPWGFETSPYERAKYEATLASLPSEVIYYLDRTDMTALAARVASSLAPGGEAVLVHWLGETDYPLSGDEAAEGFMAALAADATVMHQARTAEYRLDVLRRSGPA